MSNQLFNCAECQKTITKCLEYSHLKKNNTRICGDCMRFCKSQVGTHFDTWKNLIDKNCFKCDRYIPPKRCYLFRNLWSTKEGEKVFCDDCAIESHNESTIDSRWKTPSQKLEGVKDAVRIRSEHERRGDCLDCHPNAKTCPQCQNTFTDKGSTCKDCGKVFCSCCCMSRAPKCKEQPKEYKHDHDYKPIKHIKSENKKSSPPPFSNNECLTIELKNIKSITLTQGNLVIEFDKSKVDNYQPITQIVTSEQLSQNQELQKIRDFCQKNNKNSLNKQELNNIFKDELSSSKEPDSKNNNLLLIGSIITIPLMIILGIRFVLFKKRINIKNRNRS